MKRNPSKALLEPQISRTDGRKIIMMTKLFNLFFFIHLFKILDLSHDIISIFLWLFSKCVLWNKTEIKKNWAINGLVNFLLFRFVAGMYIHVFFSLNLDYSTLCKYCIIVPNNDQLCIYIAFGENISRKKSREPRNTKRSWREIWKLILAKRSLWYECHLVMTFQFSLTFTIIPNYGK